MFFLPVCGAVSEFGIWIFFSPDLEFIQPPLRGGSPPLASFEEGGWGG